MNWIGWRLWCRSCLVLIYVVHPDPLIMYANLLPILYSIIHVPKHYFERLKMKKKVSFYKIREKVCVCKKIQIYLYIRLKT